MRKEMREKLDQAISTLQSLSNLIYEEIALEIIEEVTSEISIVLNDKSCALYMNYEEDCQAIRQHLTKC